MPFLDTAWHEEVADIAAAGCVPDDLMSYATCCSHHAVP